MAVVRWVFYDPATAESYTFAINPTSGGSPSYEKTFQYQNTAAPDGKVLVFEGRQAVKKLSFEGKILEQTHYDAFVTWFNKANQIRVTDDLGRTFYIIIEKFDPKRERAVHSPWKHSYTVDASIVDWA
jgi:hypothetical protein